MASNGRPLVTFMNFSFQSDSDNEPPQHPILRHLQRRLNVFENRVLKRVFGPRRDEVTGEWRKLNNELNDLYSLPNIVRVVKSRMRWAGHVA
jgi:hypothetical protein